MRRRGLGKSRIIASLNRALTRLRHSRGHGVHSPYIYGIVREVFMSRTMQHTESPLYRALLPLGVAPKCAREIENLRHHCGYSTFEVDTAEGCDMVICSNSCDRGSVKKIVASAVKSGTAVVILSPYQSVERGDMCDEIVASHASTTVNRRGYLIIFNNHLPKQHFTL